MRVYEEFVRDLNKSQQAVLAVAAALQRKEKWVMLPPHRVTPTEDDRYDYTDDFDLEFGDFPDNLYKLQIKGSGYAFNSVEEFPYDMIIVDEAYKIEAQMKSPPLGYVIVDSGFRGGIWINWYTIDAWDEYTGRPDPNQGGRECVYRRCPKTHCIWVTL